MITKAASIQFQGLQGHLAGISLTINKVDKEFEAYPKKDLPVFTVLQVSAIVKLGRFTQVVHVISEIKIFWGRELFVEKEQRKMSGQA